MPSPQLVSVDWGDIVTTTLENRSGTLRDNVTNNNALLTWIERRDNIRSVSGGREIYEELVYAENQSFMWYSGTEPLNIALNDTMTAARFGWKQCSVAVVLSGLEDVMNAGEEQMMELVDKRVQTAERTFENRMSASIYSDGTGYSGKQIGGIGLLVSKIPTAGLCGGIDRGSAPWWRNLSVNANVDARGLVTSSNIMSYMTSTAVQVKRNSDGVDIIVADNNYYLAYVTALQALQRVVGEGDDRDVGAGFTSLAFYGAGKKARVILDGGKNGQIPPNTMYFLNTEYIWYRPSTKRDFKVINGERTNVNQDATVKIMAWAGNMTSGNLSLQGVLWQ